MPLENLKKILSEIVNAPKETVEQAKVTTSNRKKKSVTKER